MMIQNNLSDLFSNNVQSDKSTGAVRERESSQAFDPFSMVLQRTGKETAGTVGAVRNKADFTGRQDKMENRDSKSQVNTFRQIVRSTARNIKQSTDRHVQSVNTEAKEEKSRKTEQEDQTVALAAQVLGMNPNDLLKLLKAIGINPQEMNNVQGAQDSASRLADAMNLGDAARETLTALFSAAAESNAIQAISTETLQTDGLSGQAKTTSETGDAVVSGKAGNEQAFLEVLTPETAQIAEQLKSAVEKLALQQLEQPDAFSRYLAEKLTGPENGISAAEETGTALQNFNEASSEGILEENADISTQKVEGMQKASASADEGKAGEEGNDAASEGSLPQIQVKGTVEAPSAENTDSMIPVTAQTIQNTAQVEKTAKTQLSTPVSANDVLKQVVEKAKVILNGDKSEMIMDLKPDNLGKLSLKVVTERGMVMARFIAENQQVKEVLETNMQLLKDALEKQGMQIQEFSVSVGQQSAGGFNNSYGAPQEKGRRSAHPAISGAWQEGTAGIESAAKANAYSWTGSTVNYTA